MKAVRVEFELEIRQRSATVAFLRDIHDRWMADVCIEGIDGPTHLSHDLIKPAHPCELHAERLYWLAVGMANSGRAA